MFGELVLLRVFGDLRYKLFFIEVKELERYFNINYEVRGYYDNRVVFLNYKILFYLIFELEVIKYKFIFKDKFLVFVFDGLFDMLILEKVVKFVVGYIDGK